MAMNLLRGDTVGEAISKVNQNFVDLTKSVSAALQEAKDYADKVSGNIQVDPKPTQGSVNLISSGAVYDAIKGVTLTAGNGIKITDNVISTDGNGAVTVRKGGVVPDVADGTYLIFEK